MENLLDQQDKKLDAELAILKIDLSAQYDEELRTFKLEHENRLQHLTSEHEARYQHLKSGYLDELQQMKNEIQVSGHVGTALLHYLCVHRHQTTKKNQ